MSYLIKVFWYFTLFHFLPHYSSDPSINLIGIYEHIEIPFKQTIEFDFSENGRTCGPNTQFETVGEQFAYLKYELLKDNKMRSKIEEINMLKNCSSQFPRKSFSFQFDSIEEAKKFYNFAQEAFAENIGFWNYYKKPSPEDHYNFLKNASLDAKRKAEELAKSKGKNNVILTSLTEINRSASGTSYEYSYTKIKSGVYSKKRIKNYLVRVNFIMK